jgi:hypothetical protein
MRVISAGFGWGETSAGLVMALAWGVPRRLDFLMGGKTLFLELVGRHLPRQEPCECEKLAVGRARWGIATRHTCRGASCRAAGFN